MKKFGRLTNTWKLNSSLLNKQCVKEEITRKIGKYFEITKNEDTTEQNLWDAAKAVVEGKFYSCKYLH